MENEKEEKNVRAVNAEEKIFTTAEKAQYELFARGDLSKEVIAKWIENDLRAIASFIHSCLKDERIKDALIDRHYEIYKELHVIKKDDGGK